MLETFRKHHYIMMCLIAVVVIISFTFFFNPNTGGGGGAGSGQTFTTLNGKALTVGEIESINQLQMVVFQTAGGEKDGGREFAMTMNSIVNENESRSGRDLDPDYAMNVFIMRQECERLGIVVEKEDVEKRIRTLSTFQTGGRFDGSQLEKFLTGGAHGDRSATESKLIAAIRDVMMFEKLSLLIGGSYAPSAQKIDADFADQNGTVTVSVAKVLKKPFENQTVTDEEIQKYYDEEKAKKENPDKTKPAEADPIILTEEKRTVEYCVTEAPKPPTLVPPVFPQPPPPLPAKPDFGPLPEDQKKIKEEEWKKQEEDHKVKQDAYTKAVEDYTKASADHQNKLKEQETVKRAWLAKVNELTDALVADPVDRAGKTFAELVKIVEPAPAPPAPAPSPVIVTPPVPVPPPPTPVPAPEGTPPVKPLENTPAPATGTTPDATPKPPEAPTPDAAPKPNAVQGAQGPAGQEGTPSTPPTTPPAAPAVPDAAAPAPVPPPAEAPPATPPANTPAPDAATTPAAPGANPPVVTAPPVPPAPLPFLRTATFTPTNAPPEIQIVNSAEGPSSAAIFKAKVGEEKWVEGSDKNAYVFFVVKEVVPPAVRPLAEVKQQISDKLKEKKITEALKAAGDSARSNLLEAIKGGKPFKEAAEAAKTEPAEVPEFSRDNPLPPATPNAGVIRMTVNGSGGKAGLQAGELSDPLPVPDGLVLVYVVKKELPKFPDTDERKKKIRESQTVSGVGKFQQYGMPALNPVFKSWFAARRSAAQTATP